ncbi:MAG: oligosaccharide flippase family protein, partial [Chloroflexota bacterium]
MNLARRTVTSISWNMAANAISVVVFFGRSVLLARWLPVEVFGIYAYATAIVRLSVIATSFGMESAFLHRSPETEDEEQAAAVHFTLKTLFTVVWAALLLAGAAIGSSGPTHLALIILTLAVGGIHLAQTPRLILTRRVLHRRLALMDLTNTVLTTAVSLWLAWRGVALWALLATDLVTLLVTVLFFYGWRPVWRPRLAWSAAVVRYYLQFGSRSFLA